METLHALMAWQTWLGSPPTDLLPSAGTALLVIAGAFLTACACESLARPVLRRYS